MKLENISPLAWLQTHNIKTETGKPYDLHSHMFWVDVMCDMSPQQVWLKAAQVGGTLAAIYKKFWVVRNYGFNAIYTMPTQSDMRDFVSGKVNPIIDQNPILQEYVEDKDTIEQKRVGNNTIYYRGTWSKRQALSVSSDLNIHDEEDRSDQAVIDQYSSRQQHSPHKWNWHFSNPSVDGNGVSKYWKKSDQKHWFISCSRCSKKQYLSWPESINVEGGFFQCKHCHQPLRDEDRRVGSWHAKKNMTGQKYSGYWISLLMAPWITAEEIIEYYNEKDEEIFTNFVLGLPYIGSGNKVAEQDIFQNLNTGTPDYDGPISIGVDTGTTIYWEVMTRNGVVAYGKSDNYNEIEKMLNKWPQAIAVFDQGGDLIKPRELREQYSGRVFLCHYRKDRKTWKLIRWGSGDERGNVLVDRNRTIQMCIDEFKKRLVPIYGGKADWWEWWLHWDNIYRVSTENAQGSLERKWERSGDDHWVHAHVYARVGMDKFGAGDADIVMPETKPVNLSPIIMPDGTMIERYDQL